MNRVASHAHKNRDRNHVENNAGADPVCVDTLIPGLLGRGKGSLLSCRVEVFLKEFKRDAVAMYENDPDVSMNQVSKDVGINRATLRYWIDQFGTGKKTAPVAVEKPSDDRNLEGENRRLKRENARLREERDILWKAANYFAEETNW